MNTKKTTKSKKVKKKVFRSHAQAMSVLFPQKNNNCCDHNKVTDKNKKEKMKELANSILSQF